MELVVDANVLFSALLRGGKTRELMLTDELLLFAPEFVIDEFNKHLDELSEKSGAEPEVLKGLIDELFRLSGIKIVASQEFSGLLEEADKISPDPDDVQYFALALKLGCGIWSDDKLLKQQSDVKVFSTSELLQLSR